MVEDEWRAEIVDKLEELVTNKRELANILLYLAKQSDANGGHRRSGVWQLLRDRSNSEETFIAFAQRLGQEVENKHAIHYNLEAPDVRALLMCSSIGLASAWLSVAPEKQAKIIAAVSDALNSPTTETFIKTIGVKKAVTFLSALYLSYEEWKIINSWRNGEITAKVAAKHTIGSFATVAGGVLGAEAGVAAGGRFGTIGTVFGGVFGAILASAGIRVLVDVLSQKLFDESKYY